MNVTRWMDWRVGQRRMMLPAAVHSLAMLAAVELARERSWMWAFAGIVGLSAIAEVARQLRERGVLHELGLCPGGITLDALEYRAQRAWLGPGCTAVWLKGARRRRRLVYVWRGEVTDADYAALRRHMKALDFTA